MLLEPWIRRLHSVELPYIQSLQEACSPWLDPLCQLVHICFHEHTYVLLGPLLGAVYDDKVVLSLLTYATFNDLVTGVLKWLFQAPRPFFYDNWNFRRVKFIFEHDFGLPSGHTEMAAALSFMLVMLHGFPGWGLFLGLVVPVGIARVYGAMHFFSDVFVAVIVGTSCAWVYIKCNIGELYERDPVHGLYSSALFAVIFCFLYIFSAHDVNDDQVLVWEYNAGRFWGHEGTSSGTAKGEAEVSRKEPPGPHSSHTGPTVAERFNVNHLHETGLDQLDMRRRGSSATLTETADDSWTRPHNNFVPPGTFRYRLANGGSDAKEPSDTVPRQSRERRGTRLLKCMRPSRYITMIGFHLGLTVSRSFPSSAGENYCCTGTLIARGLTSIGTMVMFLCLMELLGRKLSTVLKHAFDFIMCTAMALWAGLGINFAFEMIDRHFPPVWC